MAVVQGVWNGHVVAEAVKLSGEAVGRMTRNMLDSPNTVPIEGFMLAPPRRTRRGPADAVVRLDPSPQGTRPIHSLKRPPKSRRHDPPARVEQGLYALSRITPQGRDCQHAAPEV